MQVRSADCGFEHTHDGITCVAQFGALSIFESDIAGAVVHKGFHSPPPCIVCDHTARFILECVFIMAFGMCAAI